MTVKLNQIVALNQPKKADFQKLMTKYYHVLQKSEPFFGQEGQYSPREENGEILPPESSKVQLKADELLNELKEPWVDMFDIVLTNDVGNSQAKADIIFEGKTIAKEIPVSTLLFLEKQISNWNAILDKIPILPLSHNWILNTDAGLYETAIIQTLRTNKMEEPLVLYPATDKHPAQCKSVIRDVNVGTWSRKKTSSAMPMTVVEKFKKKLSQFQEAVLKAREQANSTEIQQQKAGENILAFIFE